MAMDDPQRLADDPAGSVLGRSLLASARNDAPSPDTRVRAARRLGIAAVLAAGTGVGSEAGALAVAWKLGAVLLALGGVVGLTIWRLPASEPIELVGAAAPRVVRHDPGAAPVTPASVQPPSATPSLPTTPVDERSEAVGGGPRRSLPAGDAPAITRPAAPRSTVPARVASRMTPGPGASPAVAPAPPAAPIGDAPEPATLADPSPAPAAAAMTGEPTMAPPGAALADSAAPAGLPAAGGTEPPRQLAEQVALLDRARASLGTGDLRGALAALAEYDQRFPHGDLEAAAAVVMIEVVIAQRDHAQARALGAAFFARFPHSPLAQRVHSLLDRLSNRPE